MSLVLDRVVFSLATFFERWPRYTKSAWGIWTLTCVRSLVAFADFPLPLYQIVLTKADLLTPELLSACVLTLRNDLVELVGDEIGAAVPFSAVCGSSGSGVTALWKELEKM